jgi:superfamily II DNA helicase RecQ
MKGLNIAAVAITKKTKQENRHVWQDVEKGSYQIVYVSPEILLSKRGYFLSSLVRNHCKFLSDLVAVAIDEAHLIWDWIGFRDKYQFLGTIRNILDNVPWVLLSVTLSPMVAAYAHEVCNLRPPTLRFVRSMRRDNINLAVCPIKDEHDLTPLLELIPDGARNLLIIPKTLIFYDGIDGGQRIADALRRRIPSELSTEHDPHELVQMFFGSIDARAKKKP